ncbi:hypothetical protein C8F01DRAFT_786841 [Mycena amicta]|nr:hypothetical protein C8F01DRAFT_786841 [Mycena amicta]
MRVVRVRDGETLGTSMPQLTERGPSNLPPPPFNGTKNALSCYSTIRQMLHLSTGEDVYGFGVNNLRAAMLALSRSGALALSSNHTQRRTGHSSPADHPVPGGGTGWV